MTALTWRQWIAQVDAYIGQTYAGRTHKDYPTWMWGTEYANGLTPIRAARRAIKYARRAA